MATTAGVRYAMRSENPFAGGIRTSPDCRSTSSHLISIVCPIRAAVSRINQGKAASPWVRRISREGLMPAIGSGAAGRLQFAKEPHPDRRTQALIGGMVDDR